MIKFKVNRTIKTAIATSVLLICLNVLLLFTLTLNHKNSVYLLSSLIVLCCLLVFSIIVKVLYNVGHLRKDMRDTFIQIESSNTINKLINPKLPFPTTGDWAATSHFIALIYKYVLINNPQTIVELGSGASTLYTAQLIKDHHFKTKIISLDHDKTYGNKTQEYLKNADLNDIAQVHIAPLKTYKLNTKNCQWYSTDSLKTISPIDLLVVDGPITHLQKNARYPAIPLLINQLTPGAIILVDDYNRKDEQNIVALWQKEYNLILLEEMFSVKGFAVLQKP